MQLLRVSPASRMSFLKIEASVDLPKSAYAVFGVAPEDPQLDVNMVGFETTRPDYKLERDTFAYFALEMVTKGKGRIWMNGIEHRLQEGSVFTYGPNVAYRIESDRREPLQKYFLDLTCEACRYDSPIHRPGLVFQTCRITRLVSLIEWLLSDASKGDADTRVRRSSVRLMLDMASLDINKEQSVNSKAYQAYIAAREYIDEHYHRLGSLQELAAELNIAPSYLTRIFARYGNQTPYQYLIKLRVSRACYLLKQHEMQIQEISDLLGFCDPFHFSKVFKRHIGVSPRVYRSGGVTNHPGLEENPPDF